LKTDSIVYCSL